MGHHGKVLEGLSRKEFSGNIQQGKIAVESEHFNIPTSENQVELLIDGAEAFNRYYEVIF